MMELNMVQTESGNHYIYDDYNKQILYLHPLIHDFESSGIQGPDDPRITPLAAHYRISREEAGLLWKKYCFLKSHKVFRKKPQEVDFSVRIQAKGIETQLANCLQVVFELTDACNLKCKYCAYGEMYDNFDKRENKNLNFQYVINLLQYLERLWRSELNKSKHHVVYIGFYGGEPLVNFSLIESIVRYISGLDLPFLSFRYSMTTNGVLLDRYMDFIAAHKFNLLISLDGDKTGNSYRVFHSGEESFDVVYKNIKLLQQRYPDYFKEKVNFNSVLHNRNSVGGIHAFMKKEFHKMPSVSEVSGSGIKKEKQALFRKTYQNIHASMDEAENYSEIVKDMFTNSPTIGGLIYFLHYYTNNVFRSYNSFFVDKKQQHFRPTGTCYPFSRKIFLTVNGKILPCERVGQRFVLGQVDERGVEIDCEKIAEFYNAIYDKLERQCSRCYRKNVCTQCFYYINDLDGDTRCHAFMNQNVFRSYLRTNLSYIEKDPETYVKIIKEVVLQ